MSSRISQTRSPPSKRNSSSTKPRSSCSGCAGHSCPRGPGRCGGSCSRNSPGRPRRSRTLNWTRSARVAEPGRVIAVRELMHTDVVSSGSGDPVATAAAAMVRAKAGSALVMQGRLLAGILTDGDVLRAAASGADLNTSPVSAWMTKDPEAATLDTTVEDAAQLMLLHGFRHLPVLDGRQVRGVVSLRDLFAARISRPADTK